MSYRALIATPTRLCDDWFYRAMQRLPGSHVVWALLFAVALPAISELLRDVGAPISHVRSATELWTPYFFAPVILAQVLIMPLFFQWTLDCFDGLRPAMKTSQAETQALRQRIQQPSSRLQAGILGTALATCVITQQLSSARFSRFIGDDWNALDVWLTFAASVTLTMFLWYFSMAVSRTLVLAAAIGRSVLPKLFDERLGPPIATFGIRAGLIFAVPYFVVNLIGGIVMDQRWFAVIPALSGIVVTSAFTLAPGARLRQRVRGVKDAELAKIDAEIEAWSDPLPDGPRPDPQRARDLSVLLRYRREVAAIREWPISAPTLRAFAIYFLLIPLTWVASGLVEILLERMAG